MRQRVRERQLSLSRIVTVATLWSLASLSGMLSACSFANREGPNVTCAELECGKRNACKDGIIAYCGADRVVHYHVCTDDDSSGGSGGSTSASDICEAAWQTPGSYRCSRTSECRGCNPSAMCE